MEKLRDKVSTSPMSTIVITASQIWYVCVGLHHFSSHYHVMLNMVAMVAIFITLALYNTQILKWFKNILNRFVLNFTLYNATVGPRHYHFKCCYYLLRSQVERLVMHRYRRPLKNKDGNKRIWRHHSLFSLLNSFASSVCVI